MKWPMTFKLLAAHDAVLACFDGVTLETPDEATDFMRQVAAEVTRRFVVPVDYIIDYRGFAVKPKAARAFGVERLAFLKACVKRSYRFNVDARTLVSVHTSGVIDRAHVNVSDTLEQALAQLHADRESEAAAAAERERTDAGDASARRVEVGGVTIWPDPAGGIRIKLPVRSTHRLTADQAAALASELTRLVARSKDAGR